MRVTWKDGVTTVAAAGAIAIERAHAYAWDWPLISNTRWAITGVAVLFIIGFVFSYILDSSRGVMWTWIGAIVGVLAAVVTGLGLYYDTATGYVQLLMLNTVLFWVAAVARHLTVESSSHITHSSV
jgi:hypothetical protein